MRNLADLLLMKLKMDKEWLFCDYYDTIVERDCHPNDIKQIWAENVSNYMDYNMTGSELFSIRKAAETKLAEKYSGLISKSYNYSELIEDIYKRMLCLNQAMVQVLWKSPFDFYEFSLELETAIEREHQHEKNNMFSVLLRIKENGYKIAIISDFYIGEKGFTKYADTALLNVLDAIIISCDYAARKETGDLYDLAMMRLGTRPEKILMIGDNKYADYKMARIRKIDSYLIESRKSVEKTIDEQNKKLWRLMKRNQRVPYANYAFSLYYFVDELYRYLRKRNITQILFCAREGEFLKELFEVYETKKRVPKIKTIYFYVSRLSTFVPSLGKLEEEKFVNLFRQYKDISPKSFMLSIGFRNKEIGIICDRLQIEAEKIVCDFESSLELKHIKEDELFKEYYSKIVSTQKANFKRYLGQLVNEGEHLCIIDVGWKGTIQDNIFNIFDKKREITGVYLGLTDNLYMAEKNIKVGINFATYPIISTGYDIWSYDKSFYEKLLYASHASTIAYNEYGEPILEGFVDEEKVYEFVRPMQSSILKVFEQIVDLMQFSCYDVKSYESIFQKIHLYMICHIHTNQLKIQNILVQKHFQNFGEFSWSQTKIAHQIKKIFEMNKRGIIRKLLQDGLNIKYMYPGTKVMQKMHLTIFIPIYTRLVYQKNKRSK